MCCHVHVAVKMGDIPMCHKLRSLGADLTLPDKSQQNTPLHFAAFSGGVEITKWLLDDHEVRDKSLHAINEQGETPLACAFSTEIALVLLEAGANLRDQNRFGNTRLHLAAFEDKPDDEFEKIKKVVKDELMMEEVMKMKNKDGETPHDIKEKYIGWKY